MAIARLKQRLVVLFPFFLCNACLLPRPAFATCASGLSANSSTQSSGGSRTLIYAIGGLSVLTPDLSATASIEIYDHLSDTWTMSNLTLSTPRMEHGSAILGGNLYVMGGQAHHCSSIADTNTISVATLVISQTSVEYTSLDGSLNSPWTDSSLNYMEVPRQDFATALTLDGRLYSLGGTVCLPNDAVAFLDSAERFNQSHASGQPAWSYINNLGLVRSNFGAIVDNNVIYIFGGLDGHVVVNSLEKYNISTDSWRTIPPVRSEEQSSLIIPRMAFASALLNGKIYAVGGYGGLGCSNITQITSCGELDSMEVYDIVQGHWTLLSQKLNLARSFPNPNAAVIGTSIYVFGGIQGYNGAYFGPSSDLSNVTILSSTEMLSTTNLTQGWVLKADMNNPRAMHTGEMFISVCSPCPEGFFLLEACKGLQNSVCMAYPEAPIEYCISTSDGYLYPDGPVSLQDSLGSSAQQTFTALDPRSQGQGIAETVQVIQGPGLTGLQSVQISTVSPTAPQAAVSSNVGCFLLDDDPVIGYNYPNQLVNVGNYDQQVPVDPSWNTNKYVRIAVQVVDIHSVPVQYQLAATAISCGAQSFSGTCLTDSRGYCISTVTVPSSFFDSFTGNQTCSVSCGSSSASMQAPISETLSAQSYPIDISFASNILAVVPVQNLQPGETFPVQLFAQFDRFLSFYEVQISSSSSAIQYSTVVCNTYALGLGSCQYNWDSTYNLIYISNGVTPSFLNAHATDQLSSQTYQWLATVYFVVPSIVQVSQIALIQFQVTKIGATDFSTLLINGNYPSATNPVSMRVAARDPSTTGIGAIYIFVPSTSILGVLFWASTNTIINMERLQNATQSLPIYLFSVDKLSGNLISATGSCSSSNVVALNVDFNCATVYVQPYAQTVGSDSVTITSTGVTTAGPFTKSISFQVYAPVYPITISVDNKYLIPISGMYSPSNGCSQLYTQAVVQAFVNLSTGSSRQVIDVSQMLSSKLYSSDTSIAYIMSDPNDCLSRVTGKSPGSVLLFYAGIPGNTTLYVVSNRVGIVANIDVKQIRQISASSISLPFPYTEVQGTVEIDSVLQSRGAISYVSVKATIFDPVLGIFSYIPLSSIPGFGFPPIQLSVSSNKLALLAGDQIQAVGGGVSTVIALWNSSCPNGDTYFGCKTVNVSFPPLDCQVIVNDPGVLDGGVQPGNVPQMITLALYNDPAAYYYATSTTVIYFQGSYPPPIVAPNANLLLDPFTTYSVHSTTPVPLFNVSIIGGQVTIVPNSQGYVGEGQLIAHNPVCSPSTPQVVNIRIVKADGLLVDAGYYPNCGVASGVNKLLTVGYNRNKYEMAQLNTWLSITDNALSWNIPSTPACHYSDVSNGAPRVQTVDLPTVIPLASNTGNFSINISITFQVPQSTVAYRKFYSFDVYQIVDPIASANSIEIMNLDTQSPVTDSTLHGIANQTRFQIEFELLFDSGYCLDATTLFSSLISPNLQYPDLITFSAFDVYNYPHPVSIDVVTGVVTLLDNSPDYVHLNVKDFLSGDILIFTSVACNLDSNCNLAANAFDPFDIGAQSGIPLPSVTTGQTIPINIYLDTSCANFNAIYFNVFFDPSVLAFANTNQVFTSNSQQSGISLSYNTAVNSFLAFAIINYKAPPQSPALLLGSINMVVIGTATNYTLSRVYLTMTTLSIFMDQYTFKTVTPSNPVSVAANVPFFYSTSMPAVHQRRMIGMHVPITAPIFEAVLLERNRRGTVNSNANCALNATNYFPGCTPLSSNSSVFQRGDVNRDCFTDVLDCVYLLDWTTYISETIPPTKLNADVQFLLLTPNLTSTGDLNLDGFVDNYDMLMCEDIILFNMRIIPNLPDVIEVGQDNQCSLIVQNEVQLPWSNYENVLLYDKNLGDLQADLCYQYQLGNVQYISYLDYLMIPSSLSDSATFLYEMQHSPSNSLYNQTFDVTSAASNGTGLLVRTVLNNSKFEYIAQSALNSSISTSIAMLQMSNCNFGRNNCTFKPGETTLIQSLFRNPDKLETPSTPYVSSSFTIDDTSLAPSFSVQFVGINFGPLVNFNNTLSSDQCLNDLPPSDTTAFTLSDTAIRVFWGAPKIQPKVISSYRVYYARAPHQPNVMPNSSSLDAFNDNRFEVYLESRIPSIGGNLTVSGLQPNIVYLFYVKALVGSTPSGASNTASNKTFEGIPSVPPNVTIAGINLAYVNISWSPIPLYYQNGNLTAYVMNITLIEWRGSTLLPAPWTVSMRITPNDSSFLRNWYLRFNLTHGNSYNVSMAGENVVGVGPFSSPLNFTIPTCLQCPDGFYVCSVCHGLNDTQCCPLPNMTSTNSTIHIVSSRAPATSEANQYRRSFSLLAQNSSSANLTGLTGNSIKRRSLEAALSPAEACMANDQCGASVNIGAAPGILGRTITLDRSMFSSSNLSGAADQLEASVIDSVVFQDFPYLRLALTARNNMGGNPQNATSLYAWISNTSIYGSCSSNMYGTCVVVLNLSQVPLTALTPTNYSNVNPTFSSSHEGLIEAFPQQILVSYGLQLQEVNSSTVAVDYQPISVNSSFRDGMQAIYPSRDIYIGEMVDVPVLGHANFTIVYYEISVSVQGPAALQAFSLVSPEDYEARMTISNSGSFGVLTVYPSALLLMQPDSPKFSSAQQFDQKLFSMSFLTTGAGAVTVTVALTNMSFIDPLSQQLIYISKYKNVLAAGWNINTPFIGRFYVVENSAKALVVVSSATTVVNVAPLTQQNQSVALTPLAVFAYPLLSGSIVPITDGYLTCSSSANSSLFLLDSQSCAYLLMQPGKQTLNGRATVNFTYSTSTQKALSAQLGISVYSLSGPISLEADKSTLLPIKGLFDAQRNCSFNVYEQTRLYAMATFALQVEDYATVSFSNATLTNSSQAINFSSFSNLSSPNHTAAMLNISSAANNMTNITKTVVIKTLTFDVIDMISKETNLASGEPLLSVKNNTVIEAMYYGGSLYIKGLSPGQGVLVCNSQYFACNMPNPVGVVSENQPASDYPIVNSFIIGLGLSQVQQLDAAIADNELLDWVTIQAIPSIDQPLRNRSQTALVLSSVRVFDPWSRIESDIPLSSIFSTSVPLNFSLDSFSSTVVSLSANDELTALRSGLATLVATLPSVCPSSARYSQNLSIVVSLPSAIAVIVDLSSHKVTFPGDAAIFAGYPTNITILSIELIYPSETIDMTQDPRVILDFSQAGGLFYSDPASPYTILPNLDHRIGLGNLLIRFQNDPLVAMVVIEVVKGCTLMLNAKQIPNGSGNNTMLYRFPSGQMEVQNGNLFEMAEITATLEVTDETLVDLTNITTFQTLRAPNSTMANISIQGNEVVPLWVAANETVVNITIQGQLADLSGHITFNVYNSKDIFRAISRTTIVRLPDAIVSTRNVTIQVQEQVFYTTHYNSTSILSSNSSLLNGTNLNHTSSNFSSSPYLQNHSSSSVPANTTLHVIQNATSNFTTVFITTTVTTTTILTSPALATMEMDTQGVITIAGPIGSIFQLRLDILLNSGYLMSDLSPGTFSNVMITTSDPVAIHFMGSTTNSSDPDFGVFSLNSNAPDIVFITLLDTGDGTTLVTVPLYCNLLPNPFDIDLGSNYLGPPISLSSNAGNSNLSNLVLVPVTLNIGNNPTSPIGVFSLQIYYDPIRFNVSNVVQSSSVGIDTFMWSLTAMGVLEIGGMSFEGLHSIQNSSLHVTNKTNSNDYLVQLATVEFVVLGDLSPSPAITYNFSGEILTLADTSFPSHLLVQSPQNFVAGHVQLTLGTGETMFFSGAQTIAPSLYFNSYNSNPLNLRRRRRSSSSGSSLTASCGDQGYPLGDANLDCTFNLLDVYLLRKYLIGNSPTITNFVNNLSVTQPTVYSSCDIDGSGTITYSDVNYLDNVYFGFYRFVSAPTVEFVGISNPLSCAMTISVNVQQASSSSTFTSDPSANQYTKIFFILLPSLKADESEFLQQIYGSTFASWIGGEVIMGDNITGFLVEAQYSANSTYETLITYSALTMPFSVVAVQLTIDPATGLSYSPQRVYMNTMFANNILVAQYWPSTINISLPWMNQWPQTQLSVSSQSYFNAFTRMSIGDIGSAACIANISINGIVFSAVSNSSFNVSWNEIITTPPPNAEYVVYFRPFNFTGIRINPSAYEQTRINATNAGALLKPLSTVRKSVVIDNLIPNQEYELYIALVSDQQSITQTELQYISLASHQPSQLLPITLPPATAYNSQQSCRKVFTLNQSLAGSICNGEWTVESMGGVTVCRKVKDSGCGSIFVEVDGPYNFIEGSVKLFQYGAPSAFNPRTANLPYGDALTIWVSSSNSQQFFVHGIAVGQYSSGVFSALQDESNCPNNGGAGSAPALLISDYTCSSGRTRVANGESNAFYSLNSSSFEKHLYASNSSKLELRICLGESSSLADIVIEEAVINVCYNPIPCPPGTYGTDIISGCSCAPGSYGNITASAVYPYAIAYCVPVACPPNTTGIDVLQGCSCGMNNSGKVVPTSSFPYFSHNCSFSPWNSTSTPPKPSGTITVTTTSAPASETPISTSYMSSTSSSGNIIPIAVVAAVCGLAFLAIGVLWIKRRSEQKKRRRVNAVETPDDRHAYPNHVSRDGPHRKNMPTLAVHENFGRLASRYMFVPEVNVSEASMIDFHEKTDKDYANDSSSQDSISISSKFDVPMFPSSTASTYYHHANDSSGQNRLYSQSDQTKPKRPKSAVVKLEPLSNDDAQMYAAIGSSMNFNNDYGSALPEGIYQRTPSFAEAVQGLGRQHPQKPKGTATVPPTSSTTRDVNGYGPLDSGDIPSTATVLPSSTTTRDVNGYGPVDNETSSSTAIVPPISSTPSEAILPKAKQTDRSTNQKIRASFVHKHDTPEVTSFNNYTPQYALVSRELNQYGPEDNETSSSTAILPPISSTPSEAILPKAKQTDRSTNQNIRASFVHKYDTPDSTSFYNSTPQNTSFSTNAGTSAVLNEISQGNQFKNIKKPTGIAVLSVGTATTAEARSSNMMLPSDAHDTQSRASAFASDSIDLDYGHLSPSSNSSTLYELASHGLDVTTETAFNEGSGSLAIGKNHYHNPSFDYRTSAYETVDSEDRSVKSAKSIDFMDDKSSSNETNYDELGHKQQEMLDSLSFDMKYT